MLWDTWNPSRIILENLGKHKHGKGCLYIKKLEDIDMNMLKTLIQTSIERLCALTVIEFDNAPSNSIFIPFNLIYCSSHLYCAGAKGRGEDLHPGFLERVSEREEMVLNGIENYPYHPVRDPRCTECHATCTASPVCARTLQAGRLQKFPAFDWIQPNHFPAIYCRTYD